MRSAFVIMFFLAITGCAEIKQHEQVSKSLDLLQTTSIGSELYLISKTRDLPNAFGKADVWGGKVNEGYSELRFIGLTNDGEIIFQFTDIDIQSNENVFTRYGVSRSVATTNTTANASVYGNTASGSAQSNTVISHYEKPKATVTQLPANTVQFLFKPSDKILNLEGISIEIVNVNSYSIQYILSKTN